jgi:hypothetical protein
VLIIAELVSVSVGLRPQIASFREQFLLVRIAKVRGARLLHRVIVRPWFGATYSRGIWEWFAHQISPILIIVIACIKCSFWVWAKTGQASPTLALIFCKGGTVEVTSSWDLKGSHAPTKRGRVDACWKHQLEKFVSKGDILLMSCRWCLLVMKCLGPNLQTVR